MKEIKQVIIDEILNRINESPVLLVADYSDYRTIMQPIVYLPAIIAGLSLSLSLLFKGNNVLEVLYKNHIPHKP